MRVVLFHREESCMSGERHNPFMNLPANEIRKVFANQFNTLPLAVTRAPGRVELLGNHTDYNEGLVLSCALDRYIYAAAGPTGKNNTFEFFSTFNSSLVVVADAVRQQGSAWVNYPLGVYTILREKGFPAAPFALAITGTIPMGAGLSSSAALEIASGLALSTVYGFSVDPVEMAHICRDAESTFCGTNCGLLDQFSVLFGKKEHALFIDFRSLEHQTVPIQYQDMLLAITTSGVTHSLSDSAYNGRRKECAEAAKFFSKRDSSVVSLRDVSSTMLESAKGELDDVVYKRAAHVIGENERVRRGVEFLKEGKLTEFGTLLYQSHESSRVNFENSCPELDTLVDYAASLEGVYGSRLTGGGWGGATLTLIHRDAVDEFRKKIRAGYKEKTGREASVHFAAVTDGAGVIHSKSE
ncbi:MAG: galactokinase [Chitinivibrionales bacterium]|nr:galactokinase [Chitinivibrionales bacterium]